MGSKEGFLFVEYLCLCAWTIRRRWRFSNKSKEKYKLVGLDFIANLYEMTLVYSKLVFFVFSLNVSTSNASDIVLPWESHNYLWDI